MKKMQIPEMWTVCCERDDDCAVFSAAFAQDILIHSTCTDEALTAAIIAALLKEDILVLDGVIDLRNNDESTLKLVEDSIYDEGDPAEGVSALMGKG